MIVGIVGVAYAGGTANKVSVYIFGDLKDKTAKPHIEEKTITEDKSEMTLGDVKDDGEFYVALFTITNSTGYPVVTHWIIMNKDKSKSYTEDDVRIYFLTEADKTKADYESKTGIKMIGGIVKG